jgi:hypothetical protein
MLYLDTPANRSLIHQYLDVFEYPDAAPCRLSPNALAGLKDTANALAQLTDMLLLTRC